MWKTHMSGHRSVECVNMVTKRKKKKFFPLYLHGNSITFVGRNRGGRHSNLPLSAQTNLRNSEAFRLWGEVSFFSRKVFIFINMSTE